MLRDLIRNADDLSREVFPTPEWPEVDGKVFARGLKGDERDEWEAFVSNASGPPNPDGTPGAFTPKSRNWRATLVSKGLCDEHGVRIFENADIPLLGSKSTVVLNRAYDKICALSGMGENKEDAAKNLSEMDGSSSSTDSPDT